MNPDYKKCVTVQELVDVAVSETLEYDEQLARINEIGEQILALEAEMENCWEQCSSQSHISGWAELIGDAISEQVELKKKVTK